MTQSIDANTTRDDVAHAVPAAIAVAESGVPVEMHERVSMVPGRAVMVVYGVGDAANSIRAVLLGLFVFFFYTSVMGLPGTLAGIASGVGLVSDALVDPYIGHASDRAQLRLGRRHSFMLVGAVGLAVTTWALFGPPLGMPTAVLFGWFLGATLLGRLAAAAFAIPYFALGVELSSSYDGRTALAGVRGLCSLLGGVAATVLAFAVFFPNTVSGQDPKLRYDGYPAMGLVLGLAMAGAALVATFGTLRWRGARAPATSNTLTRGLGPRAALALAVLAFRYSSFRVLFVSFAFIYLGSVINVVLSLHFLTYFARIADSGDVGRVRILFYVGALMGIPCWMWLAPRVDKCWLYVVGGLITVALMIGGYVLVGPGRILGTGDARPIMLGQGLAGFGSSVFLIIPFSMLADVTDEDRLACGEDRQGMFFGLVSFGQKMVTGVSIVVAGVLIDAFAGLVPGEAEQSATTVERIGLLENLLPAGLLLVGVLLILRYPLDRSRVAAVQAELARRTQP